MFHNKHHAYDLWKNDCMTNGRLHSVGELLSDDKRNCFSETALIQRLNIKRDCGEVRNHGVLSESQTFTTWPGWCCYPPARIWDHGKPPPPLTSPYQKHQAPRCSLHPSPTFLRCPSLSLCVERRLHEMQRPGNTNQSTLLRNPQKLTGVGLNSSWALLKVFGEARSIDVLIVKTRTHTHTHTQMSADLFWLSCLWFYCIQMYVWIQTGIYTGGTHWELSLSVFILSCSMQLMKAWISHMGRITHLNGKTSS